MNETVSEAFHMTTNVESKSMKDCTESCDNELVMYFRLVCVLLLMGSADALLVPNKRSDSLGIRASARRYIAKNSTAIVLAFSLITALMIFISSILRRAE